MTAKELHNNLNQDLIEDEVEAIDGYDKAIEESDNPEAIAVYEHIKNEEVEHIAELEELDKMKAEDITSEQAWQDFKAGYTDFEEKHVSVSKGRDGDQASLGQKIDLMNAKLTELNTDVSRLNDAIPQALGTIEEAKTEETEEEMAEEGMGEEGMELGGEEGEEDVFGEEDDGLSEFFDESDEGEESEEEGEDVPEDFEDEDNFEAESDEEGESEEPAEEGDFEEEGEEVEDEDSDNDYLSLEDLESEEETEGEEEEDEQDEILEKMVQVLKKMDMRLTRLERENAGLRKQLSKSLTVQATPVRRSEQRQEPRNLRLVKGSYNRPPVSTQYVANQRDIGVMKSEGSGENTPVFKQELDEVFAECNRIANQTR